MSDEDFESKQWASLRDCLLDNGQLNKDFRARIEDTMHRRERVNIAEVSNAVGARIGKKFIAITSELLWDIAPRTKITIVDKRVDTYA